MVHKVDNREKKEVFTSSLIITLVLMLFAFSWGFYVEYSRSNKIIENYKDFEIEALDLKLQNYYYQIMERAQCDAAIEQNFIFADSLYNEGLDLERYEEANQITEEIEREKKRYVLLKNELWLNTILLKEKCRPKFDTLVYLYANDPEDNSKVSEQQILSNVLKEIKEERGNDVVLIPIAGNLDLGSVELQMRIYNVTYLPSLVINEEVVLEGFQSKEDIESHLMDLNTQEE